MGFERFSALGPLALLPLPGEYRRSVVWPVKKGTEDEWLGEENDQHFLSALQQTYGDRAGKFEKKANVLAIRFHKCLRTNKRLDALF